MISKTIYPKTERIKVKGDNVHVTEKLDGSNLCIFKYDDVLHIAQRKRIYSIDEIEKVKDSMYKGLYQWLIDNKETLNKIRNWSAICGEWLGMGQIKYTVDEFDKRFYMFAKANIDEEFNLYNIQYNHELFLYPFEDLQLPSIIGIVPEVANLMYIPDKDKLDLIYDKYCNKVNRKVEGFVINYKNIISKYVRMKNGKLVEYSDNDHKGN